MDSGNYDNDKDDDDNYDNDDDDDEDENNDDDHDDEDDDDDDDALHMISAAQWAAIESIWAAKNALTVNRDDDDDLSSKKYFNCTSPMITMNQFERQKMYKIPIIQRLKKKLRQDQMFHCMN